jgi:flagellar hook-associated protein 3 FlgL
MVERITHTSIQRAALSNLQINLNRLNQLQERLTSGKRLQKPSDDPAAAVDSMRLRSDQRAAAQYARNAENGVSWLSTLDMTLTSAAPLVTKVRTLLLATGNPGYGQSQRNSIATQLDALKDNLLETANTKYLGRSVFAGNSDANSAYSAVEAPMYAVETDADGNTVLDTDGMPVYMKDADGNRIPVLDENGNPLTHIVYRFAGSSTDSVQRRISSNSTVRVDSDGSAVWGDENGSIFELIGTITNDLRAGKDVTRYVAAIDTYSESILQEAADVGTRYNLVTQAQTAIQDQQLTLKTQLSDVEDADLPSTIVDLKLSEVAYQGALAATGKMLQPTLLDYLA